LGGRKGIQPVKMGWRWALVSSDAVASSRMVGVFASVNLPLHRRVEKFSSGTELPLSMGESGPHVIMTPWAHPRQRVHNPNGISVGSAIVAQIAIVSL